MLGSDPLGAFLAAGGHAEGLFAEEWSEDRLEEYVGWGWKRVLALAPGRFQGLVLGEDGPGRIDDGVVGGGLGGPASLPRPWGVDWDGFAGEVLTGERAALGAIRGNWWRGFSSRCLPGALFLLVIWRRGELFCGYVVVDS